MAQFQISPEIPRRLEIWRDRSPLYCKPMGRKDVAYPVSMVASGNAVAAPLCTWVPPPPLPVITLKWAWANFSFCCYWKGTLSSFQPLIQFKHSHKKGKYGLCVIYSDLKFIIPSKLHVYYNPSYVHCFTTLRNKWPHCWVTSHYVTLHLPSLIKRVFRSWPGCKQQVWFWKGNLRWNSQHLCCMWVS